MSRRPRANMESVFSLCNHTYINEQTGRWECRPLYASWKFLKSPAKEHQTRDDQVISTNWSFFFSVCSLVMLVSWPPYLKKRKDHVLAGQAAMIARLGSTTRVVKLFSAGYIIVMPPTLAAYPRTERTALSYFVCRYVLPRVTRYVEIHRLEVARCQARTNMVLWYLGPAVIQAGHGLFSSGILSLSVQIHGIRTFFVCVLPVPGSPDLAYPCCERSHMGHAVSSINFPPFGLGSDGASAPVRLIAGRPRAYVVQSIVEACTW